MTIIFGWLIFSILVGVLASTRGRSGFGFFVLSLVLSPLIGFIVVLVIDKKPTAADREAAAIEAANSKKCPFCAETIKAEASVCRYCGKDLPAPAVDTRTDDQRFEAWLANQKPPLKLSNLSPEEREEMFKAFRWANAQPARSAGPPPGPGTKQPIPLSMKITMAVVGALFVVFVTLQVLGI